MPATDGIALTRRARRWPPINLTLDLVSSHRARAYWYLRARRPSGLFQPFADTYPDRYPSIFRFVSENVVDRAATRLLSFGCSTGEEVFSLRRYFPTAHIRGLDINPLNIAVCRRRLRKLGDQRIAFAVAGSVAHEQPASYDAVFCMAVLRHGDLSHLHVARCDHRITFQLFEHTVADLARCVKEGGLLIIEHSNFRFADTATAAGFMPVMSVEYRGYEAQCPVFGRDNRRLIEPACRPVVFRKLVAG